MNPKSGFSLTELLLYVGILAIVSGLFIGILLVTTRVNVTETASNEVANQMNFVLQTIQRLVRESSNIELVQNDDPSTPGINEGDNLSTSAKEYAYLKLRMPKVTDDPICISLLDDNSIRVTQGPAVLKPNDCKEPDNTPAKSDSITTNKVLVPVTQDTNPPGLVFTKFSNPPGHDIVQIDLTLNYKTDNPQSQFSKKLSTAVGRVSAATFDSHLLPGGNFDVGLSGQGWNGGYFKGDVTIEGNLKAGGNNKYFQFMNQGTSDPPNGDCNDNTHRGRFYLKTSPLKLFFCTGSGSPSGWKSITLN